MRERLVGFRHAVNVFLLLDRIAAIVGGVEQLVRELSPCDFSPRAREYSQDPADASDVRRAGLTSTGT